MILCGAFLAALLVFNSAMFKSEPDEVQVGDKDTPWKSDWDAIRDVGNSAKAGDADARIGRFGLGFTSGVALVLAQCQCLPSVLPFHCPVLRVAVCLSCCRRVFFM